MRRRPFFAVVAAAALVAPLAPSVAQETPSPPTVIAAGGPDVLTVAELDLAQSLAGGDTLRLAGEDRFATAAAIAAGFAPGGTVLVASGRTFADALPGVPLAASLDAPLLLVEQDRIPPATAQALTRLDPSSIILLGGPVPVAASVAEALEEYTDGDVTRVAGDDRYATAGAIADRVNSTPTHLYLAVGTDFPDALAGGTAGGVEGVPVLLTLPTALPLHTIDAIIRLDPDRVVILGGPNAISVGVADAVAALGPEVERVAGLTRYDTAVRLADRMFPDGASRAYLTNGRNFPDALALGVVAAGGGDGTFARASGRDGDGPLLLTEPPMPQVTQDALARLVGEGNLPPVVELGGPGVRDITVTFTEGDGPTSIVDAAARISDADGDTITSLVATLQATPDGADEVLAVDTSGTTVAADFADGALTLTSSDAGGSTTEDLSTVLATLVYDNEDQDPSPDPRTVDVRATDNNGETSAVATATITVIPVDDAPVAVEDAVTVAEDDTPQPVDVLDNDTDVDAGPINIDSVTQPAAGTVVITNGGADVTYAPDADFCNSSSRAASGDAFTYTLAPGGSTADVSVFVACDDDAPVAVDDVASVTEDDPATPIAVRDNDTDVDDGPMTIVSVTQPPGGTVVITNGGDDLTYTPTPDFCNDGAPTDDFTYTLNGGNSATVAVSVACVDDAPVAVEDEVTVAEDASATALGVLTNDTDVDGGPIAVDAVTQPAAGTVLIAPDGVDVTYEPDADFCNDPTRVASGDAFTYTLAPGGSTTDVSVDVTCVDDAPVAVDDTATVTEDDTATAIDVLDNDTDVDGGTKEVTSVDDTASNGSVAITGGGTGLTYAPDANYCNNPPGTTLDTFTYTLNGGSSATVTVTVDCVDDAPVATDDTATVTEDDTATAIDVLDNDTDVDGGTKEVTSVDDTASNGSVAITGGGTGLTYAPDANYCNNPPGTTLDTFTYTLNGGSSATVTVTVDCVDDAPVATDDTATVTEDDTATAIDVLDNDTDVDGGTKEVTSVDDTASNGSVAITGGGTGLTYAPDANYCNNPPGTTLDTFTYTLNGGSSATVTVTVDCVDDAPVATDDTATVTEDDTATAIDVLDNDTDVDGDGYTITLASDPASGSVVITGSGTGLTYAPDADYCNDGTPTDDFTYTISDGIGTDTATVEVTVTCVNDPPVAVDVDFVDAVGDRNAIGNTPLKASVAAGAGPEKVIVGTLLEGDSDPEGDAFTVTAVQGGTMSETTDQGGTVTANADGTFTYLPPPGFEGDDTFTYEVTDDVGGGTDTATATIEVIDVVWYVDSSAVAGGDGRAGTPYVALDQLNGASDNVDSPGDIIFLHEGTSNGTIGGAYVNALLEEGQSLLSEDVGLVVDGVTLVTASPGNVAEITGGGAAVTLADNTTVAGVATLGTTGPGFLAEGTDNVAVTNPHVISSSNDGVRVTDPAGPFTILGRLTIDTVGGQGLEVTGSDAAGMVAVADLDITGSTANGVLLGTSAKPNAGTVTIGGGSIAPATGVDVVVGAGSANVTINAAVASNTLAPVTVDGRTGGNVAFIASVSSTFGGIRIGTSQSNSGGTLLFAGAVTLDTGPDTALQIANSAGFTTNVTGNLDIDTTTATGIDTVNGGTLTVAEAPTVTVTSTSAAAIRMLDTTIGLSGMHLDDVTSDQAPTDGASFENAGSGPLTISGGSITNAIGDGLVLDSTGHVTIESLTIGTSGDVGLLATDTGDLTIRTSTFTNSGDDNARITATSGTSTVTIDDAEFSHTTVGGNNGLLFRADGTSTMTLAITDSRFLRNFASGLMVVSDASANVSTTVNGTPSTFTDNFNSINANQDSNGTHAITITGAVASGRADSGAVVNINSLTTATGTMTAIVEDSTLSSANSLSATGVRVVNNGSLGQLEARISGNTITLVGEYGIFVAARDGNTPGNSIDATITDNTVTLSHDFSLQPIRVDAGATSTDTVTVCADIDANTTTPDPDSFSDDIRVRQRFPNTTFQLPGYTGGATDTAAVSAYLLGRNTSSTASATVDTAGFTAATCTDVP